MWFCSDENSSSKYKYLGLASLLKWPIPKRIYFKKERPNWVEKGLLYF